MAVMRKEPKDIAKLGPIGIVREALKLYSTHFKDFVLIQLTLMLPLAILLLLFVFAQYFPLPAGASRFLRIVHSLPTRDHLEMVEPMLVWIPASLFFQAAVSLSHSTTLYSVGVHYSGQPVSFVDVVCAVTPRLWIRLALTALSMNLLRPLLILGALVVVTGLLLVGTLLLQYDLLLPYSIATMVLPFVGGINLAIILRISSGVPVLDEDYGWATMRKGLKLLDGKGNVATLYQVLWTVPAIIEIGFVAGFVFLLSKGGLYVDLSPDLSPWALALSSFTVVAFLTCTTFFWELRSLCAGLSVLTQDYGWAAMKKSLKELEGKGNVAIFLQLLWIAPAVIEIGFVAALVFLLRKCGLYVDLSETSTEMALWLFTVPIWILALLSFTVVAFLAWTTFFWQLRSLCVGVQYVSLSAHPDESYSHSLDEKRTIPMEGSERFGGESKVPLLKGALLEGKVV